MNQNPDIAVTANSVTLEIMKDIFLLKNTDVFHNFPDHESLDNVLRMVYPAFYKNWNYKYIIDRGPVGTVNNLGLMKKYFKQPIKCIVLLRDLLDVLASYVKWFETEPTSFINRFGRKTIESKLSMLMHNNGAVAKELKCIQNLLKPENKSMCCFIKYDELVENPEATLQKVYTFLNIPYFSHTFVGLNQLVVNGIPYNDNIVGRNMHLIRTDGVKKIPNPYRDKIPQRIKEKYEHISF